jgi:hypothetical protein
MDQLIRIGWKSIGEALGVSPMTARRVARRYEMPVVELNGRPSISGMELEIWWAGRLLINRGIIRKEKVRE